MKRCEYCKDPIYKFQEFKILTDKKGKKKNYHIGCFEILTDKIVNRIKKRKQNDII